MNPSRPGRLLYLSLLLCTFLITAPSLFAQSPSKGSISGFVRDKESGETLILANVMIDKTAIGAATNTSGYYTITGLVPGKYTVSVSYLGYDVFKKEVTVEPGGNVRLDINLNPADNLLEEVTITSEREKEEQKAVGTVSVSTQMIKKLPAVIEADVFRSIQLLPGVKSSNDFSAGLYIRGGSPDQTLILLDRTTVYNPSHFFGFYSTFNPDAIKDLRLYKGGYPAQYGGRLGSVVDVYNKDGNRKQLHGGISVGLLASRASIEGPFNGGSYMFAVRRSTIDPLLWFLSQSNDNIPTSFYFADINGKINFDLGDNDKLSIAGYGGQDKVKFPFAEDGEFRVNYGNRTTSANWTHIFNERLFSHFTLTSSRYFNFPGALFGGTTFERDNNIWDNSVKGDLEFLPNQRHNMQFGFWAGNMIFRLEDEFDGQQTFNNRIATNYVNVYFNETWYPSLRWKITGGMRANWFAEGNYFRLEPRVNVEYKLTVDNRLQFAYGRYNQFLTLITNDSFSAFDVWLTTAEGVPPAWGDQFVIGDKISNVFGEGYNLDIEGYYREMHDLFELNPFLPDAAGLGYKEVFRFGDGYAYGAEVTLEKTMGRLNGFVGYSYSVTRRRFPTFNVPLVSPSSSPRYYPPRYDRTNDLVVVANYQLTKKWRLTSSFYYATGQAYTEPTGHYSIGNNPTGSSDLWTVVSPRLNANRLPSYHRMDLSFTRLGKLFKKYPSEFQFQIINVYNRKNIWFYNLEFDSEDRTASKTPITQLPLLPSLSYSISF
jgi:hypothetical protein